MSDDYQLRSWCDPYAPSSVTGLVGQIHFVTAFNNLDSQDVAELTKLQGPFSVLLRGHRVHFWCAGNADHRGTPSYNESLGLRRAIAVQTSLDRLFHGLRLYSADPVRSHGELYAHFLRPSRDQLAEDRRVDIFANVTPNQTPMLPLQQIIGRRPPQVEIREVPDPTRGPTTWMLATPTSQPSQPVQGQRSGEPVTVIPRLLSLANQASVEMRIREGLEEVRPLVQWRMMDHARGGILIVATIDVREHAGSTAASVLHVTDYAAGVFGEPNDAIGRWRREPHLEAPSARAPYGRIEYRYFWATRR